MRTSKASWVAVATVAATAMTVIVTALPAQAAYVCNYISYLPVSVTGGIEHQGTQTCSGGSIITHKVTTRLLKENVNWGPLPNTWYEVNKAISREGAPGSTVTAVGRILCSTAGDGSFLNRTTGTAYLVGGNHANRTSDSGQKHFC